MLRIAICDDDAIMRAKIAQELDVYARRRNLDIIYDQFSTGAEFLRTMRPYNIVILDYKLDKDSGLDGMQVAQRLRAAGNDISVIFLSSYPDIVFSSFEVSAFRFLVKPVDENKLFSALDDFLKTLNTDMTLMIHLDGATSVINTNHISHLEGYGKYCLIHTVKNTDPIECHETLRGVEQRLPTHLFYRCHRSFVVNFKYVGSYDHQEITLRNGNRILISRNKFDMFQKNFIDYSKRYGY